MPAQGVHRGKPMKREECALTLSKRKNKKERAVGSLEWVTISSGNMVAEKKRKH